MPDVVVFGATGHTGRLVSHALARHRARFAVAGRDRSRLGAVARDAGAEAVHVAAVGDVDALARALGGARVLLTCVGPFHALGDTAVRAALAAGVHYVDASGEASFVARLRSRYDEAARAAGVTIAPCLAFDEVAADVAATLATRGMSGADLTLTYAVPSSASAGTVRSALHILTAPGAWPRRGGTTPVVTGSRERWAPMPPPLGVRPSLAAHMAETQLAPLHLDVTAVSTYVTTSTRLRPLLRVGLPLLQRAVALPYARALVERAVVARARDPRSERARRKRWTVLAEARADAARRNVVVTGTDVYGLSAELLAAGALHLAGKIAGKVAGKVERDGGVMAPVQAVGLARLEGELRRCGVTIEVFEPR